MQGKKILAVFVFLLALALLGAAVAQVVNVGDWQFWSAPPAGATVAGQVQRFFAKGLVPLFAGVVALVYGLHLLRKDKVLRGMADSSAPLLGADE